MHMSAAARLEPADREFFETVARTAFCNPFSEERTELDAKIVGYAADGPSQAYFDEFTRIISSRVRKLETRNLADVRRYGARDRELMRTVFLIDLFHAYCGDFDGLIGAQLKAGDESLPVKFAEEMLGRMSRRGIGAVEALRFISIGYQLRRAYHLIVRGLIGNSPSMRVFRGRLWQNVFTQDMRLYERHLWERMEDFSTLLLGETGTGKGTAAAAIGQSGYIPYDEKRGRFAESFTHSFIALNLSHFPVTLIESELFGHCKGAFTGAVQAHQGVLARCSPRGAIFLDEIGDVSVPVQIKLLQVLQDRTFCPVGTHEPVRFRGRVIAATNHPLETLRRQKLFRNDFFYRLCSDIIEVPPLRQRLEEDPGELRQLIMHALNSILGQPTPQLVAGVAAALAKATGEEYSWPGNVRELEQATRRVLLTGTYIAERPGPPASEIEKLLEGIRTETLDAQELLAGYCKALYEKTGSYGAVARRTNLDWRTVKKYVDPNSSRASEADGRDLQAR
jgi:hypothetical protein